MLEEQFSDVLRTFQQHDYGRSAGMAWTFLTETKRIFHSIVQVLVISLDRNAQDDVLVGTLLRHLGCEALVYPSVRNDYVAIFEKGTLRYSSGWNLVDYRGAPQPGKVGLDFGDAIEPLRGENILEEHREGPRAGSLALRGNSLYTRIANEMAWHERAVLAGSEWRLKYRQRELLVRGYMWCRRRYSLADQSLELTCDRCSVLATQNRAELMWACPNCQYGGDL